MNDFNETFKNAKAVLDDFQRERPSISSNPVANAMLDHLRQDEGIELVDYATACNGIDLAVFHLDEGLPIGQNIRCSQAIMLLEQSVIALKNWMLIKGYSASQELMNAAVKKAGTSTIRIPKGLQHRERKEVITGQVSKPTSSGVEVVTATVTIDEESIKHTHVQRALVSSSIQTELQGVLVVLEEDSFHGLEFSKKEETADVESVPQVQSLLNTNVTIKATGVFDYDDPSTWKFKIGTKSPTQKASGGVGMSGVGY